MGAEVARGQKPPLLPEKDVAALANELTGETAKRNLEVKNVREKRQPRA